MLLPLYATLVVAIVFYLVLPLASAAWNGLRWRRFRHLVEELSKAPPLTYGEAARLRAVEDEAGQAGGQDATRGLHVMRATMEALEGDHHLWIRSPDVSAIVDFSASPLYVLSPEVHDLPAGSTGRAGSVQRFPWRRVRSFSEGTRLFVAGMAASRGGRIVFSADPEFPLVAISYDEDDGDLVSHIVAGGRSRNELWNSLTFASWSMGVALLSLLFINFAASPNLPSVMFISALVALAPVLPLAPPGMALLIAGNALWRANLRVRIERDLSRVAGATGSPAGGGRPGAEGLRALFLGSLAGASVGLAIAINGILAFLLYRVLGY